MRGAVITSVKGFGTEEGDDWAYVVCTLQPGEDHILAFDESVADRLCAAVLQATAHIQRKEMERRDSPVQVFVGNPLPVENAFVSIARGEDAVPILVLSLETRSGAQLHFHLSNQLAEATAELLARFSEPAEPDAEDSHVGNVAADKA